VQVWERSIKQLPRGRWQLSTIEEQVYLMVSLSSVTGSITDLYLVDTEAVTLTHILRSGSHHANTRNTWMQPMDGDLLAINVDGGSMAGFKPLIASERITSP
jgi:hypothetical protein